ncbi:glycerate kinase-like isoform X2 [Uloborus diversus]|uniref:glycerate kinase-like isoform X2 n=1 Tax=Uloborus diversus TaxID=327109 RepID=UPI002409EA2C|nr:glycerate kinase-like isoform X2 [Uloborus diversus]
MQLSLLLQKSILRRFQTIRDFSRKMTQEILCKEAEKIFAAAVNSVKPEELISNSVNFHSNTIEIQGKTFHVNNNVHIVGFGKAVLGMALALESMLKTHVISSMVSVPQGVRNQHITRSGMLQSSHIQIFEGASNNIPDSKSFLAATKIAELVTSLSEKDLLFILISGGGSALLPLPKSPLTLEEKQKVIKLLAGKGATIQELNTIRKRLSVLKGGGLARLARPAQVVSLILSDIIGNPLDYIASGPTVRNTDNSSSPMLIIKRYNLLHEMPQAAIQLLQDIPEETKEKDFSHVNNFVIGNNEIALQAAASQAIDFHYAPIILTSAIKGSASQVGPKLVQMVNSSLQGNCKLTTEIAKEIEIGAESVGNLLETAKKFTNKGTDLCIVLGGETTVEVRGKGIGGRNQELALAATLEFNEIKCVQNVAILLLSAGTDGIDGPTDAAGAFAAPFILKAAKEVQAAESQIMIQPRQSFSEMVEASFYL